MVAQLRAAADDFRGTGAAGDADLPKWVARQVFWALETGDVAEVDRFCHADYRNFEAPEHAGPEGFRAIVALMRRAFSDLSFAERWIICRGDTVALWTVMRGRHTGHFHGLAPTGRVVEQRQTHWVRVQDGKLMEHHAIRDDLGLLIQLGVVPSPGGLAEEGTGGIPSCTLFDAAVQGAGGPHKTTSRTEPADTRDMIVVHTAFRREFRLAPALVRGTSVGDLSRVAIVAAHLELMSGFLHFHHTSEDRLLWPMLNDRASDELPGVVTLMQTQHKRIHDLIAAAEALIPCWKSRAGAAERDELAGVLDQLYAVLEEHLDLEERRILPLAAELLSPSEWQQLGEEAMAELPRDKLTLVFGMFMYQGDTEVISSMLSHAPLLPRLLLPLLGSRAYARYARRVHGTTKP